MGRSNERPDEAEPAPGPDARAAHQFLSELRTRISTQPLPYQYGVEARALESLWEVFAHARTAMKDNPGGEEFARRATRMLNVDLRPVTAKWHRAHAEGRLLSRDGANEFRADLEVARNKLRAFAAELHVLAYGHPGNDDETPPAMPPSQVESLFEKLEFGISAETGGPVLWDMAGSINDTEKEAVTRRRSQYGFQDDGMNAVGLGLSGGGIRSATFCLGVVQVLASRSLLREVDFLSTVSGGGFLGAFVSTVLGAGGSETDVTNPRGPDTPAVRHLRKGAKYLAAGNLKERWMIVTATLAGMILNWMAPLFPVAIIALAASAIGPAVTVPWAPIFATLGVGTGLLLLVYAYAMRYHRHTGGVWLGLWVALSAAVGGIWILSHVYARIRDALQGGDTVRGGIEFAGIAGLSAAVAAALPVIVRFVPVVQTPRVRRIMLKLALVLAGLIVPIGAIAVGFAFAYLAQEGESGFLVLLGITAVFGVVAFFLLDINMTAPHRIYRDHIARTFIRRDGQEPKPVPLTEVNSQGLAPYHLINATVNLPSSDSQVLRERKGDFFLFSKGWCGAPSIGYWKADEWRSGDGPVDLATAIAVSGAAASSHMGLATIPSLSALLSFLNVRLGYWMRRPRRPGATTPGFTCLVKEMFGIGMHEHASWLNLSDGGHLENMGVYELLRRRCKFIISVDGEADASSTFHGHLALVRHALIDFGVRIEPELADLRPDKSTQFSQSHSMMCRVHYPPTADKAGGVGLLLYLKLSMTGNEVELIKRYRTMYPDFPHQSTLDQFFDEEQFEAYRQLGVHVAEGLFHPAVFGSDKNPGTVSDWFRGLAAHLLLPER